VASSSASAIAAWTTPFNHCITDEDGTHRYEPDDLALLEDVFVRVNQAHCAKAGIKAIDTKTYIQAALAGKIPEPLTGVRHGRVEGNEGTSSPAPGSSSGNYEGGEAQANVFGGLSTVASGLQAGFYNSGRAIAKQVGLPALQKGIVDQITEDLEALGIQVEGNIEEIAATVLQSQLRQGSSNVFQQPSAPLAGYLKESQPTGGLWN